MSANSKKNDKKPQVNPKCVGERAGSHSMIGQDNYSGVAAATNVRNSNRNLTGAATSRDVNIKTKNPNSTGAGIENDVKNTVSQLKTNDNINAPNNTASKEISANFNNASSNIQKGDVFNPMIQAQTLIEHKVRNLEKRKTKLEAYRSLQAKGKSLNAEQKHALAKYDGVLATLEFARDLSTQINQMTKDAEKELRKLASQEVIARGIAEATKIRDLLTYHNIINCYTDDLIRTDLEKGQNGAIKLDQNALYALDKFAKDTHICRPESPTDTPFLTIVQKAAEFYSFTVEGSPKQYSEHATYEQLRNIFQQIQECGYLDTVYQAVSDYFPDGKEDVVNYVTEIKMEDNSVIADGKIEDDVRENFNKTAKNYNLNRSDLRGSEITAGAEEMSVMLHNISELQLHSPPSLMLPNEPEFAPYAGVQTEPPNTGIALSNFRETIPQYIQAQELQELPSSCIIGDEQGLQQMMQGTAQTSSELQFMTSSKTSTDDGHQFPQDSLDIHGTSSDLKDYVSTTVQDVEQDIFRKHQEQQFLEQYFLFSEIIGNGSFYFLQESELDSPELEDNTSNGNVNFDQQQQQFSQEQLSPIMQNQTEKPQIATAPKIIEPLPQEEIAPEPSRTQEMIRSQTFTNQSYSSVPIVPKMYMQFSTQPGDFGIHPEPATALQHHPQAGWTMQEHEMGMQDLAAAPGFLFEKTSFNFDHPVGQEPFALTGNMNIGNPITQRRLRNTATQPLTPIKEWEDMSGGSEKTSSNNFSNHGDGCASSSNNSYWNTYQRQHGGGHFVNNSRFQRRRGRAKYSSEQRSGRGRLYFRNNSNASGVSCRGSYLPPNKDSISRYGYCDGSREVNGDKEFNNIPPHSRSTRGRPDGGGTSQPDSYIERFEK